MFDFCAHYEINYLLTYLLTYLIGLLTGSEFNFKHQTNGILHIYRKTILLLIATGPVIILIDAMLFTPTVREINDECLLPYELET